MLFHCKHYLIAKLILLKHKSGHLTPVFWTLQGLPLSWKETQTPYHSPQAANDSIRPLTLAHVPPSLADSNSTHTPPPPGPLTQMHPLPVFLQRPQRGLPCHPSRIFWTAAPYLLSSLDLPQCFAPLCDLTCFPRECMLHEHRGQVSLVCSCTHSAEHWVGHIEAAGRTRVGWERRTPAQHSANQQWKIGQLWYWAYRTLRPRSTFHPVSETYPTPTSQAEWQFSPGGRRVQ